MHIRRLNKMVVNLIEIINGPDEVRADMFLPVEALQSAPDTDVLVRLILRGLIAAVLPRALGVDPFLDVDGGCAVVEGVGDVGRLRVDLADLAD